MFEGQQQPKSAREEISDEGLGAHPRRRLYDEGRRAGGFRQPTPSWFAGDGPVTGFSAGPIHQPPVESGLDLVGRGVRVASTKCLTLQGDASGPEVHRRAQPSDEPAGAIHEASRVRFSSVQPHGNMRALWLQPLGVE